jgi:hypothetical protein
VLDYKTGEADSTQDSARLVGRHRGQLEEYARAASALWPGKPVRTGLVLANGKLVAL